MKDYQTDKIRNISLLGHGGSGKTSLAEAMLFLCKHTDRQGKIPDGNTVCDYDQEEIKRKFSINTAIAPCEWKDYKINFIDTPGYFDFVGEVMEGTRVSDAALILLPAKNGLAVGTEKSWKYVKDAGIPAMFVVTKLDEENADFEKTLSDLTNLFGSRIIPFQFPIVEGNKLTGIVDVIKMKVLKISGDKVTEADMPASFVQRVSDIRESLKEGIAETDEDLMNKFFEGEDFTPEEFAKGLSEAIKTSSVVPVMCCCAMQNAGVSVLLDKCIEYFPSPAENKEIKVLKHGTDEEITISTSSDAPLSALVFKTIADQFGKLTLFRVYSGTMRADSTVFNTTTEKTERIVQLFVLRGKNREQVDKLIAGDIGCIPKLQNTNTNDTLCAQQNQVELPKIKFPQPSLSMALETQARGDEEKIGTGLARLIDEDPTFSYNHNPETKQIVISGQGDQHLDVITSKLKNKFGITVTLSEAKVPYREKIKKKVKVEGKHKKQSGGHGQYGHVWIEFEPNEEEQLVFEEKVFGGSVPKQYFPAVEKGLQDAIKRGVLAGYPVIHLKATLVDGSYHDVDSSEMSFKLAASLAYRKGMADGTSVIMEPVGHVEVNVPDNYMGDIIGDINKRRGRILGMNPQEDGYQQVVAEVPQAEMGKYATDLRAMTQGRGSFSFTFTRYEEAPPMISQKVIEEAKKTMTDEEEE